jgi:hypothetical protein
LNLKADWYVISAKMAISYFRAGEDRPDGKYYQLHDLKVAIAAGQIAIDRGEDELEALRLHAVESGDAADAADVLEFRGSIANFRGKVAEMREALVGSAMLIPIIGQTRQAAETRMMKISNGYWLLSRGS